MSNPEQEESTAKSERRLDGFPGSVANGHSRRELVRASLGVVGIAAGASFPARAFGQTDRGDARAHLSTATSTFVGRVQGSDAYIAVVKEGRRIGGYVCDNGSFSRWIGYAWLRDGRAPLRAGTTGRVLGSVRISGRVATGTIEVGGHRRRFRAVRTPTRAGGLHFGVGKEKNRLLVAGWILLPDGTQRGAISSVDTQTLRPGATSRAPSLDPDEPTVQIGDPGLPPTEPQQLVVLAVIAVLIALLVPAVQR